MNKKRISMRVLTTVTVGLLAFSSMKLPVGATESYSLPVVEDTDAGEGHIYSTPANLKWSDTVPGRISFDVTDATRGYLYVEVYKDGLFHTSIGTYRDSEGTFSLDLDRGIYDTGAYTFRVKMSADKSEGYKDMSKGSVSEMSEAFNYVRPEVAVATPVNLRWSSESENVAEWDPVENAKWYSVIVYSDGDFYLERQVKGDKNSIDLSDYIADVDNHTIQFTVRADSKNINTWAHGAESELSPALKPGASVSGMQNKIAAASDADESTVNEAVTQLATEEDKQTMRDAIQNSTEAQQNLSRLENTYTQKNNIEVSSSSTVDAIPSDGISVVGAGLNVSEAGSSVSLNVTPVPDAPAYDTDVYKNVIAFDMKLTNKNGEVSTELHKLAIPVVITLPIPSSMDATGMSILHFKSDGSCEKITPALVDNKTKAKFTIYDFSTFAFAQEKTAAEDKVEAFVKRMYKVALDRTPSADEGNGWVNGLKDKSKKGADIALGFYTSPELLNKKLSNGDYVELAYKGIMGRESDEGGKKNWVEALEAGVTYNVIVKGFVESTEFKNLCAEYNIEPGEITVTEPRDLNVGVTKFVSRLYTQALGRGFDGAGLNDWCSRINADPSKQNIMNVATVGFFHSSEFLNKDLSNKEFVKVLYRTFLGREYDDDGLEGWVDQLDRGEKTRDQVMEGFAYSPEFGNIMASYGL